MNKIAKKSILSQLILKSNTKIIKPVGIVPKMHRYDRI